MTTDTYPKGAYRTLKIAGENFVIVAGIAKGSEMIAPDMATMLAFIFTDAKIMNSVLDIALKNCVKTTFNAITVDGGYFNF